jgi:hypothetical protein
MSFPVDAYIETEVRMNEHISLAFIFDVLICIFLYLTTHFMSTIGKVSN